MQFFFPVLSVVLLLSKLFWEGVKIEKGGTTVSEE
jgi:hypothetical protein